MKNEGNNTQELFNEVFGYLYKYPWSAYVTSLLCAQDWSDQWGLLIHLSHIYLKLGGSRAGFLLFTTLVESGALLNRTGKDLSMKSFFFFVSVNHEWHEVTQVTEISRK